MKSHGKDDEPLSSNQTDNDPVQRWLTGLALWGMTLTLAGVTIHGVLTSAATPQNVEAKYKKSQERKANVGRLSALLVSRMSQLTPPCQKLYCLIYIVRALTRMAYAALLMPISTVKLYRVLSALLKIRLRSIWPPCYKLPE